MPTDETPWWFDHQNIAALLEYLRDTSDSYDGDMAVDVVEKPWKWQPEYDEMLAENQEADEAAEVIAEGSFVADADGANSGYILRVIEPEEVEEAEMVREHNDDEVYGRMSDLQEVFDQEVEAVRWSDDEPVDEDVNRGDR